MQFITTLQVIILGIIEGFTEWLPISSTGHMKLFNSFWALQNVSDTFVETFEYVIQLAAILAVIILAVVIVKIFKAIRRRRQKRLAQRAEPQNPTPDQSENKDP
jgi:undecaprenyl-diphosphatase